MNDFQKQVDTWAQTLKNPYWAPLEILARLTEDEEEHDGESKMYAQSPCRLSRVDLHVLSA
jgi:hypothetical protein